jgi:hypothetical protein
MHPVSADQHVGKASDAIREGHVYLLRPLAERRDPRREPGPDTVLDPCVQEPRRVTAYDVEVAAIKEPAHGGVWD